MLRTGWSKTLQPSDLYTLGPKYQAEHLSQQFEKAYDEQRLHPTDPSKAPARPSLYRALWRVFGPEWAWVAVFRVLGDACMVASPVVLKYLIAFVVRAQSDNPQPEWEGYALMGALFVVQALSSFALNHFFQVTMTIGLRVRAALISVVFRKMLRLSESSRSGDFNAGKITNIVSSDCARLDSAAGYLHYLWSAPLMATAIIVLLILNLGSSALPGIGFLFLLVPVQAYLTAMLVHLRGKNAKITDSRIRKTSEILTGIRIVKYFALEPFFERAISRLRKQEMKVIFHSRLVSHFHMYDSAHKAIRRMLQINPDMDNVPHSA